MDVLMLSRLQFAFACIFHFLFVPLTLGLSLILAILETRYVRTGDKDYLRLTKFLGKIFLINFLVGVVTGIPLEFQFGTNWSRYSEYVGDIFGSLLAIEASAAFFLESTMIAVWAFGWKKLSAKAHAGVMWLIAIGSNISALWIIIANAWMQNPVGYVIRNGRAELENFWAVIGQGYAHFEFVHTVLASFVLGAFVVAGICAWQILNNQKDAAVFKKCFKFAISMALVFSVLVAVEGHQYGVYMGKKQPAKLASLESHWETSTRAPMYLLVLPKADNSGNLIEALPVPGLLSFLAGNSINSEVTGLNDIPADERPPVLIVHLAFRVMVVFGSLLILMAAYGLWRHKDIERHPRYLKLMVWIIPLPYIVIQAGWIVAEVGRQPWIVYGMMKTSDAVSPVSGGQVAGSLAGFLVLYILLGILAFWTMAKEARHELAD